MLHTGQRLGDFEVIRLLGRGGMGEVYEAQQFDPPRRVALKVLAPRLADSDEVLRRFWRESDALARLDHPGIVRVLTRGRAADGTAYYTMQLIRGASLAQLLKEAGGEPPTVPQHTAAEVATPDGHADPTPDAPVLHDEAPADLLQRYREDRCGFVVHVGTQAAGALAAAHREGVLHRDLKPSNLMLDRDGHVYLVDFGLARVFDLGDGSQSGCPRGTPRYMSPEQACGLPLDERSDVYSLGVTLYELASGGRWPWAPRQGDVSAVLEEIRAGRAVPLRALAPDVPEGLARVIETAMRPAPAERYPSAAALQAALKAAGSPDAEGATVAWRLRPRPPAGPPGEPPSTLERPARLRVRRALLAAVLLAAVALSAAVAARALRRPEGGPGPAPAAPARDDPFLDTPVPAVLRERPYDLSLPLFDGRGDPLYAARVWGDPAKSGCEGIKGTLNLRSFSKERRTLLAIDNDPRLRWFDFSVELQRFPSANKDENLIGVFFGYRRDANEPERDLPFFMLELQEDPKGLAGGRLVLGWSYAQRRHGARGEVRQWLEYLPGARRALDLPAFPQPHLDRWRTVRIKALDHTVEVTVSTAGAESVCCAFDTAALARGDFAGRGGLDPRGALGIWADNGLGFFRNASVQSLRSRQVGER
jgi:serine/threonine protein kinase